MPLLKIFVKNILWAGFLNISYFPIWWYTVGLKKRFLEFIQGMGRLYHNLALKLMITHIFKPMYGEKDWKGRLISFFMRLIILISRLFLFILGFLYRIFLLVLWFILPIISVYQIIKLIGF